MFTLKFPVVTPTLTLELRDPVFGDILRVTHNAIIRDTRSGELKNFNDPTWPIINDNVYQFTTITEIKAAEVKDFLSITAGLEPSAFLADSSASFAAATCACALVT